MDPTTQAFVAALIGALVAGGGVLAWHVSERQQSLVPLVDTALLRAAQSPSEVTRPADEPVLAGRRFP